MNIQPVVIEGRKGVAATLPNGYVKILFDDGGMVIAVPARPVTKYNQNHDDQGRFATSEGDTNGAAANARGVFGGTVRGTARLDAPPVRADGTIELTHYTRIAGLETLDPKHYGEGIAGAEAQRQAREPRNWVDRTYYGIGVGQPGGYVKEQELGAHAYKASVGASKLYDMASDPDELHGRGSLTRYEHNIKAAGYSGYWVNHSSMGLVAAVFKPLKAQSMGKLAKYSEDQERDERGRWALGDSGQTTMPLTTGKEPATPAWRGGDIEQPQVHQLPPTALWYSDASHAQQTTLNALPLIDGEEFHDLQVTYDFGHDNSYDTANASFTDSELVPGNREVPVNLLGAGPLEGGYKDAFSQKRIARLAATIKENGKITPVHVGLSRNGEMWVIEGQHRTRALQVLGYASVPAKVIVDMEDDSPAKDNFVVMREAKKLQKYNPDQARDDHGRWVDDAGMTGTVYQHIIDATRTNGGISYKPITHLEPQPGDEAYMVSAYPERGVIVDAGALKATAIHDYVVKNQDLISKPDHYFGTWHDKEATGKVFLDVAIRANSAARADSIGRQYKQIAYFSFKDMTAHDILPAMRQEYVPDAAGKADRSAHAHAGHRGVEDREYRQGVREHSGATDHGGRTRGVEGAPQGAGLQRLAKDDRAIVESILEAIKLGDLALLMDESRDLLEEITIDGAASALAQIGFNATESITNQLNQYALDYAQQRSAEMVGMKWVDGELVQNPNAAWVIADSTREMLRSDIADGIAAGLSNDNIASGLAQNYAFSDERAQTIARTETAYADIAGNLEAYRASGQVAGKQWIVGAECCDFCDELNGEVVDLDEDFPNDGGDGPPLHPNCRCDLLPVLSDLSASDEGVDS